MLLELKNIYKNYIQGTMEVPVLKDINLCVEEGEYVAIMGPSGSGKSTLMNIIGCIDKPTSGTYLLDDVEIEKCKDKELSEVRNQKIGFVFQNFNLLPRQSALDNVALPLMIKKTSGEGKIGSWRRTRTAREKADAYFEEFGLSGYEKKYPAQLSGGMRQRAALLRTYLFSQEVALLDEPFSALDTITKGKMHQWYLSIMEEIHMSTLFITHDMDEAIILSDRIYILGGTPAVIQDEITVSGKKPGAEEFKISPEFLEYKKRILEYIQ